MKLFFLFFFFLGVTLDAGSHKTICLNMIVKDESAEIKRCLDSVKPLIDSWVIVDLGSVDGTQSVIKECLKDIPGELYEKPLKGMEENCNEALQLAKGKADYILFMGGEDWIECDSTFQLPALSEDVYCMWWKTKAGKCLRRQLIKASLPWKWKFSDQDYLVCEQPCSSSIIEQISYIMGGAVHKDAKKYRKYIETLEKSLSQEPGNAQNMLYLAESYRAVGEKEKALELYEKLTFMRQDKQSEFWSLLQVANLQQELFYPIEEVLESYYRAYRNRPYRVEPTYCLAHLYNTVKKYELAYEAIKSRDFIPKPIHPDTLGGAPWMEEYGLSFELSLCSLHLGKYQESLKACEEVLKREKLPEDIRKQALVFKEISLQKLNESSP